MDTDLEFFGNIKTKISMEGLGYYITSYESPNTFDAYPEVKAKFVAAEAALTSFTDLIDAIIIAHGGDPDDYEA